MARTKGSVNTTIGKRALTQYSIETYQKAFFFISEMMKEGKLSSSQKEEVIRIMDQMSKVLDSSSYWSKKEAKKEQAQEEAK